MSTLAEPDGLVMLRAIADAARTSEGRRMGGEPETEVRGALTDKGSDPRRRGGDRHARGER